ncbi:MAG TPA: penicillin-binding transpeptidase domain-containing protein, partial [Anaerolineaceae bacterium]|nr:penicillin-binding transpeptidase domain-containing protein [Anaerolineaceae bacterium]
FENNRMARIIPSYYYNQLQLDPRKPLFNHAISAEHPPGSVFKLAPAVGILNENVVTVEQEIFDPGKITIQERFSENEIGFTRDYVCYTYRTTGAGHGYVNFIRGVALSCDVYFYKVGGGYRDEVPVGLNIWRIGEYARALGYGEITGIELPGEMPGLIPDPTWKRINVGENWSTGDTYIATMGQGYVLSTPIQVLVSFTTIANDGIMMKPTLVREILDVEGNVIKPFEPVQVRDIRVDPVIQIYDENFRTTGQYKTVEQWVIDMNQDALRDVVVDGTSALIFRGETVPSAGKTGTAEYCDNVAQEKNICIPGSWPAHAWYVGYAPYDDPEIAVVAFVYDGDEGAVLGGPVVKDVMETYFALKALDLANQPGQ